MSAIRHANAQLSGTRSESPVVVQRGVGDGTRPLGLAGAAQRRGEHHVGLHGGGEPSRGRRRDRRPARRVRSRRRRRRSPSPTRPTPIPAAPASRAAPTVEQILRPPQRVRRGGEPADAERIGGQTDQGVGLRFPVGAGQPRGPGRPSRAPSRASRADAGTTPCVLCASDAKRPTRVGTPQQREVGVAHWRSGPGRRRRPRVARARRRSSPRAAANAPGRRRRRHSSRSSDRRRYQQRRCETRYRRARIINCFRISLVNSLCAACYGYVNRLLSAGKSASTPRRANSGNTRHHAMARRLAITLRRCIRVAMMNVM